MYQRYFSHYLATNGEVINYLNGDGGILTSVLAETNQNQEALATYTYGHDRISMHRMNMHGVVSPVYTCMMD